MTEKDKERQETMEKEVDIGARKIGADTDYGREPASSSAFGLCSDCVYLDAAESEYGIVFARCEELEIKINRTNIITKCTKYRGRGKMELWEMKEIAIYIDDSNRTKAGFGM